MSIIYHSIARLSFRPKPKAKRRNLFKSTIAVGNTSVIPHRRNPSSLSFWSSTFRLPLVLFSQISNFKFFYSLFSLLHSTQHNRRHISTRAPRRSGPGSAWVIPAKAGIQFLFHSIYPFSPRSETVDTNNHSLVRRSVIPAQQESDFSSIIHNSHFVISSHLLLFLVTHSPPSFTQ